MRQLIILVTITLLSAIVIAQTTRPTRTRISYVPKDVGQTKQRTDGATRGGVESPPPVVRVLTPLETALVASEQPTLYWSISQPTKYTCDVVVKTLDDEPVFEKSFEGVAQAGLVPIDLSGSKAKLKPNQDYRFAVFVTVMPTDPASDIESSGTIRYVPPEADLGQKIDAATGIDKAALLAESGYFTGAVAALKADGSDEAMSLLKELLQQVKLELPASQPPTP